MLMSRATDSLKKRAIWYVAGFILFFGPLALYPRLLQWILGERNIADIHAMCLRMPVGNLLTGNVAIHGLISVSFITFVLLIVTAFLFGPLFCGKVCAAGAIPEYLSRVFPKKWQIDWSKVVNPTPIRYGFFAAFLIAPFVASALTCGFCHFAFLQKCAEGGLGVLGSTTILTAFMWLILFGIFAKGGRGYCNFMCPIGALQSLVHSFSSRLGFTWKLKHNQAKCTSCGACTRECPMGVLENTPDGLTYNIHNCITCRHCEAVCPKEAISYGKGEAGWVKAPRKLPAGTGAPVEVKQ